MHSLNKIKILQRRCTVFHSRSESALLRYEEEYRELCCEEESINEQMLGLKLLLKTLQAEEQHLTSEQIYSILRRQAVVRRQMQQLDIQLKHIQEKTYELDEKKSKEQKLSKFWLRKEDNYQRWITRKKIQYSRQQSLQEELESEEIM